MKEIYADNASTTKMREEVFTEMKKFYSNEYGNPSSFHYKGLEAKKVMEDARKRIAEILNCEKDEIIFTSGGTESINFALKGIAFANQGKGKHIITSKIEHLAVLNSCKWLEKQGFEISYLNADEEGIIKLDELKNTIRKDTILISIMSANNEIGVIQPIEEIGKIAKDRKIYFHTDACQIAGALDIDVSKLKVDLLTLNGSKIYGPKGIGLLYIKRGVNIEPLIHGGGQEKELRGGTENIPAIAGFAKALELVQNERLEENERLTKLRNKLIDNLLKIKNTKLNGHQIKRLPNNVNISFFDIEGESILLHLNEKKVYASTGSACSSHSLEPSHVLLALGLSHDIAHGSIRFSLGKDSKEEDIDYIIEIMPKIVEDLRKISPVKIKGGLK